MSNSNQSQGIDHNIAAQAWCGLWRTPCLQMKDMACNNTTEPRSCHASAHTDVQNLWHGARCGKMNRSSAFAPGPQSTPQKLSHQQTTCISAPASPTVYKNTACAGKDGLPKVRFTYKKRFVATELHSKSPGVASCNVGMRSWSEEPANVVCTAFFQIPRAPPEIMRTS